jgi:hypothetical protein
MKHRFVLPVLALSAVAWFAFAPTAPALQSEKLLEASAAVDPGGMSAAAEAPDSNAYAQGTRAINDGRWSDAVAIFSQVASQAGEHADGALYWKAYAQNKLGQSSAALETCGALRRGHSGSNWIEECGALEIEIHAKSGQPVQPNAQQSDDLKLLALADLMQHDEKRALSQIDQILNNSDSSAALKKGALYIMGQHHTDTVYPQIARVSMVEGDVRIARGIDNRHDKSSAWEKEEANTPLESGYSLVTGADGRAEIEFEDASTMYLAENSVLLINDLTTTAGVPTTEVALLSGTATLHIRPYVSGEIFLLHTPTDNLLTRYPQTTNMRISSYADGIALTPIDAGALNIPGSERQEPLVPGQSLYYKDGQRIILAGPFHQPDMSAWDQWVASRYSRRQKEMTEALKDSGLASPIPGLAEMQGQGTFFACEPYGTCWEPTPAASQPRLVENALPEQGESQSLLAAQPQTTSPGTAATTPVRKIGFKGRPMPNVSASTLGDMGAFWPCIPDQLRAMYFQGTILPPWAWAVCHAGEFYYQGDRYAWVVGRRHHHPPCQWVKSGHSTIIVPAHPRDVKDHLPVNRTNPVITVNPKGPHPIERVELDKHAPVALMKEPPREFRAEFVRPLWPAGEPHMVAHRVQDVIAAKGELARSPGIPITFNPRIQSFMMTQQQMKDGRSMPINVPINNHTGDLQGHMGGGGGGGASGFHGEGASGFHGGSGSGSVAHGSYSGGSSGGGSHASGSSSGSSPGASSGTSSAASSASSSSGGSHH